MYKAPAAPFTPEPDPTRSQGCEYPITEKIADLVNLSAAISWKASASDRLRAWLCRGMVVLALRGALLAMQGRWLAQVSESLARLLPPEEVLLLLRQELAARQ